MDYKKAVEAIKLHNPELVYLSGKTCTGKTTLADYLASELDCGTLELDDVVSRLEAPTGVNKFIEVYRNRDETELIAAFVSRTVDEVERIQSEYSFAIIEGAIANNETLQEVVSQWSDKFMFVYLHPVHLEAYTERITARFMKVTPSDNAGLPKLFWEQFSGQQLARFFREKTLSSSETESIEAYAKISMDESEQRLAMFESGFKDILVLEV